MEGTTYLRIVFLSYTKLYHYKISCTTSMTAGMATTVLDGSNNTDMTIRKDMKATSEHGQFFIINMIVNKYVLNKRVRN